MYANPENKAAKMPALLPNRFLISFENMNTAQNATIIETKFDCQKPLPNNKKTGMLKNDINEYLKKVRFDGINKSMLPKVTKFLAKKTY
jgi:hypothetical protein